MRKTILFIRDFVAITLAVMLLCTLGYAWTTLTWSWPWEWSEFGRAGISLAAVWLGGTIACLRQMDREDDAAPSFASNQQEDDAVKAAPEM